jgi:hypothetical protein
LTEIKRTSAIDARLSAISRQSPEEQHFARAALRLGITPPALDQKLESRLGAKASAASGVSPHQLDAFVAADAKKGAEAVKFSGAKVDRYRQTGLPGRPFGSPRNHATTPLRHARRRGTLRRYAGRQR